MPLLQMLVVFRVPVQEERASAQVPSEIGLLPLLLHSSKTEWKKASLLYFQKKSKNENLNNRAFGLTAIFARPICRSTGTP